MNFKHIAIASLLFAPILVSCDDVAPGDRYIEGEPIEAERAVLLEDFTGQLCLNCPIAHEKIEELEKQYGRDKLIAVSIHGGQLGIDKSRTNFTTGLVGLKTEEGNAIVETYGITSFPMGVIDFGSPINYDLWAGAVREAIAKPTDTQLDLRISYTPDGEESNTGVIEMNASIESSNPHTGNLQFWIVEDHIIAHQRNSSGTIPDYEHNNVFRAQLFLGERGEAITIPANIMVERGASIATRWNDQEHWVVENLSVIAIVSDATGVIQVVRKPVPVPDDPDDNSYTPTKP